MTEERGTEPNLSTHAIREYGNATFIGVGIALFLLILCLRYALPGQFSVNVADLLLLILPIVLWLLASGQIASFKVGSSGLQVVSAIQNASSRPLEISKIDVKKLAVEQKTTSQRLREIVARRPQALSFALRNRDNYYDAFVLKDYIISLSQLSEFRCFLFFDSTPTQPFLGRLTPGSFVALCN